MTRDDCSHVALRDGDRVIHVNFLGLQVTDFTHFQRSNTILHQVDVADPGVTIEELQEKYSKVTYDFGALLFLGLNYILKDKFVVNLWQTSSMFLCTEFATDVIEHEADSMITPHQLYQHLTKED
jgi:hypothetical protein